MTSERDEWIRPARLAPAQHLRRERRLTPTIA